MAHPNKIYCVVMRGGTSKALFFKENDLPKDRAERNRVILRAMGSPDRRQIDGLGGSKSSTSKTAVISVSDREDSDIDYDFGQVSVDMPIIGWDNCCGNISSAVGPYAIDEGLVNAVEPITTVRIYNIDTNKRIIAHVPVKDGKTLYKGDYSIDGVPGTASRIDLDFIRPQGAVSGKVLPTGNVVDEVVVDGKVYHASLVDAANPFIFVRASELGLKGTELPWEYEALPDAPRINRIVEAIRCWGAFQLGFVDVPEKATKERPVLPKIGFYTGPVGYIDGAGREQKPDTYDITGRLFSMGKLIDAYMGTGTVCTMVAANIEGTIINQIVSEHRQAPFHELKIGHPFGIIDVKASFDENGELESATLGRTARRIMEGYVNVD